LLLLPTSKDVLEMFDRLISGLTEISFEKYKEITEEIQKVTGAKGKALFMVLRIGITGVTKGPDLDKICTLLDVDDIRSRIRNTLDMLLTIC